MRKSENYNNYGALNKSPLLKYIKLSALIIILSILLSGCFSATQLSSTPTPEPSDFFSFSAAPDEALNTVITEIVPSNNTTPVYDDTYPVPLLGNSGANIENGGMSTADRNNIYYIDDGIWSMSKNSENKVQITDMQNISCLNNTDDYIYFLSTHDGTIYRVKKEAGSTPESLNITGAGSLIIIGDYMYYSITVGENATHYTYRSPLSGTVQECLFIKASGITPDGAYFYYGNMEDNGSLWRYDTVASQNVKITNDRVSQLNIINDKLYYISADSGYNVMSMDRSGLNQTVVVTQGCTDLNIIQNYLIYRTINTGYIQSYNMKSGDTITLVSYQRLLSLSASGNMIFFQSCPADGYEPETYIYDITTSMLNKPLPKVIYAYIKNIDSKTLTFDYDNVAFYQGQEAIDQYAAYNSVSPDDARQTITSDDGSYFIYNKNIAWIRCSSQEWTNMTLIRRTSSMSNNTPYTASLSDLESLFLNNPSIEGKLLFEITLLDKKAIEIKEIYYPIKTGN